MSKTTVRNSVNLLSTFSLKSLVCVCHFHTSYGSLTFCFQDPANMSEYAAKIIYSLS